MRCHFKYKPWQQTSTELGNDPFQAEMLSSVSAATNRSWEHYLWTSKFYLIIPRLCARYRVTKICHKQDIGTFIDLYKRFRNALLGEKTICMLTEPF